VAINADFKLLRFLNPEALCCQNMLHLTRSYPQRESSKRTVRRGVAVTADYRHSRKGDSKFRADYMDYSLMRAFRIKERDSEVSAILPERVDLPGGDRILDGDGTISSWNVVINCRER
jgi:hypothetical protein